MKDHEKRELIDRLTVIALRYVATQQLRERISGEVLPALNAAVAEERKRMRALIADDASAMTYQTIGNYRSALLNALKDKE